MSSNLFTSADERLCVTSFADPANTLERTRVRVQFETVAHDLSYQEPMSLGFNEVVELHRALDRWIAEHKEKL